MRLQSNTSLQKGKYKIVRVLGQGGFGITYLAEHTSLDKLVAIKEFFPKDFCTRNESDNSFIITGSNTALIARLRKRFMKEAKNIAKLDHPGIVKIHDVFQENGTAYYVMDYIEGDNLSSIVKQNGPLEEEKAINYIVKVGEALEYMHSRKMTHFDVKPANIIIKKETDTPVLVDFGLSKLYTSNTEETSTLLQAVSSGFSPIELYNGESLTEFSPQSDVYSLGATLYFLLTGKIPPNASSLISSLLTRSTQIPNALFTIIQKSMRYTPKERFLTVRDLYCDIIEATQKKHNTSHKPFNVSHDNLIVEYKNKRVRVNVWISDILGLKGLTFILSLLNLCFLVIGINYYFEMWYAIYDPGRESAVWWFNMDLYHKVVFIIGILGITISGAFWFDGLYRLTKLEFNGYKSVIIGIIYTLFL